MSKKLLLADDSITIQKVIQITFAHEDYELTITDNGDAALVKAQEIKPDLVMTDIYMPGKNGYELTSAIKQNPALQHIPVLLLAGSFEPFDEDKARSCKADAWIEKPFESQSLIDKVAELLSAAQEAPVPVFKPVPIPEPEPVIESAPVAVPEPLAAVEETPLAAFDEPVSAEPELTAASDDPFGDISFEDEAPVAEPKPVAAADDWSDVVLEPAAVAPAVEEPVVEEVFAAVQPFEEIAEDFSFAEETPVAVSLPAEEAPVAEVDLDVFDMADDEIMPLGDDDILGEEDLEPVMPEQTLAAWSRDDSGADVFAETIDGAPVVEDENVFAVDEPVATIAPTVEASPSIETPQVFGGSAKVPVPVEEAAAEPVEEFVQAEEAATEPVAAAAVMDDVEAKASALGEKELEQIIEKVVTKVVEKLAGSILERVAWDVVPDLAENMIREEIRKIKDAAA